LLDGIGVGSRGAGGQLPPGDILARPGRLSPPFPPAS